jgi:hypothetical protein
MTHRKAKKKRQLDEGRGGGGGGRGAKSNDGEKPGPLYIIKYSLMGPEHGTTICQDEIFCTGTTLINQQPWSPPKYFVPARLH